MKAKILGTIPMLLCCTLIATASIKDISQIGFKNKINTMKDKVVKGACDSSVRSLTKALENLQKRKEQGKVSSGGFKTYLGNADRYLKAIKSKCPDLEISTQEEQLASFRSEYNAAGGADGVRKATMQKGYYDKQIDQLVPETHQAYNNYYRFKTDLLTKAFEYYRHKKPTNSFKSLKDAKEILTQITNKHQDLNLALVHSEIERLEGLLNSESGSEISSTLNKEADANYFRNLVMNLPYIYSEGPKGARGAKGLKDFTGDWVYKTNKMFESFTVEQFQNNIETSKKEGTYPRVQFYAEQVQKALNDYPAFISKSNGMFNTYIDYLNDSSVKGNPQLEIEQLKRAQIFCKLLLKFAPGNPTASKWLTQVENQMKSKKNAISYDSEMHEKYLGKMLFSKKEITVGNEVASDFTTSFKAGDHIYGIVYLPTRLRELTDSYAMNNMEISINGGIISNPTNTAVWVTSPMQDKNYLQFALLPSEQWKKKNGKPYLENDIRTFEHTLNGLINAGPYSDAEVGVKLSMRKPGQSFRASFKIDVSSGLDELRKMLTQSENERLSEIKLPKAGMNDVNLQNQALAIMRRKSEGSGKTYNKAIITSVNWDYDKSYAGVTVSRSIDIAMVSKEHDGKCMYQYINFKQQAKGDGTFNSNLEFAGAGTNVYISCDNVK